MASGNTAAVGPGEGVEPQKTMHSPDRLYKAPKRLYKNMKILDKTKNIRHEPKMLTRVATNISLTNNIKYPILKNNLQHSYNLQ